MKSPPPNPTPASHIQSRLSIVEQAYSIQPPLRYTMGGEGLFLPSRLSDILEALTAAELKPGEHFLDLGSGDGRVVCMAAAMGARACGIESDAALDRAARARAADVRDIGTWGVGDADQEEAGRSVGDMEIELVLGDFLNFFFGNAGVIFYYGGGNTRRQDEIYAKLGHEMRPGARVIVFRTAREPQVSLPKSSASRPPYFYIFSNQK